MRDSAVTTSPELLPLCVGLDGTLVRTNLLLASLLLLLKRNPLYLFAALAWLARGKEALKAQLAARVVLDPACLPYHQQLIAWLRRERESGRKLWLCTTANETLAGAVAAHLRCFDGIIASDPQSHLTGTLKAQLLVERFGDLEFDYCGSQRRDLPIWRYARGAIVVNASASLEREVRSQGEVTQVFPREANQLSSLLYALRPR
jgi:phosphoserine phosphatase